MALPGNIAKQGLFATKGRCGDRSANGFAGYGICASTKVSVVPPSALTYSANPATYVDGTAISANNPTVTGTVTGYSISPSLPAGLSIHATTGVISGTPTVPTNSAVYTVTASNAGGSTTCDVTILVNTTLIAGLIAFWKLGEAAGAARADSSGNAYTLTDNGTVTQGTGVIGNCAVFDGATQYLTRSATTWGFGNTWSISSWHKQTAAADSKTIYQFGASMTVPTDSAIRLSSNYMYIQGAGTDDKLWVNIPKSTNWIHTIFTWDGTNFAIWQNGSDITGSLGSVINDLMTQSNLSRTLTVGAKVEAGAVYGEFFSGSIDAIGVWSRVITSTEIARLYNSGSGREHNFI